MTARGDNGLGLEREETQVEGLVKTRGRRRHEAGVGGLKF